MHDDYSTSDILTSGLNKFQKSNQKFIEHGTYKLSLDSIHIVYVLKFRKSPKCIKSCKQTSTMATYMHWNKNELERTVIVGMKKWENYLAKFMTILGAILKQFDLNLKIINNCFL